MWFWKLLKLVRHVLQPYRRTERHVDAGGVRGVRILQNHTEIRINTAQNNIRKLQTALKLAENFWIPQTAWFCTTAMPQLKIKIPAKPHHRKPLVFNRRSYMFKVMDCTPCWQGPKPISTKLLLQFLSVWAETVFQNHLFLSRSVES